MLIPFPVKLCFSRHNSFRFDLRQILDIIIKSKSARPQRLPVMQNSPKNIGTTETSSAYPKTIQRSSTQVRLRCNPRYSMHPPISSPAYYRPNYSQLNLGTPWFASEEQAHLIHIQSMASEEQRAAMVERYRRNQEQRLKRVEKMRNSPQLQAFAETIERRCFQHKIRNEILSCRGGISQNGSNPNQAELSVGRDNRYLDPQQINAENRLISYRSEPRLAFDSAIASKLTSNPSQNNFFKENNKAVSDDDLMSQIQQLKQEVAMFKRQVFEK